MPYVAQIRAGRGLLTGWVSTQRAGQLVTENPGAVVIEAADRPEAFRLAHHWSQGLPPVHGYLSADDVAWWRREHEEHPEVTAEEAAEACDAAHGLELVGAL